MTEGHLAKDQLIQIHLQLIRLRKALVKKGVLPTSPTPDYTDLNITPMHVHRNKADHARAILVLSRELGEVLDREDYNDPLRPR